MRAFPRIRCECAHMLAFPRMRCECAHMRAFPRMRCECAHMLAFPRMRCECAHFCACDANARISRMLCECSHMRAFLRMRCDAMRMRACDAMRMRASRGNLCVSGTVCIYIMVIFLTKWDVYQFRGYRCLGSLHRQASEVMVLTYGIFQSISSRLS